MKMKFSVSIVSGLVALVAAHEHHDQTPIEGPHPGLWYTANMGKLPGDGGTQVP
jgi:agmatinase